MSDEARYFIVYRAKDGGEIKGYIPRVWRDTLAWLIDNRELRRNCPDQGFMRPLRVERVP